MENQCDIFLYFKEYIDLFLKTVTPYLVEQTTQQVNLNHLHIIF